jgi:hypothetical protein
MSRRQILLGSEIVTAYAVCDGPDADAAGVRYGCATLLVADGETALRLPPYVTATPAFSSKQATSEDALFRAGCL